MITIAPDKRSAGWRREPSGVEDLTGIKAHQPEYQKRTNVVCAANFKNLNIYVKGVVKCWKGKTIF